MLKRRLLGLAVFACFLSMPACVFAVGTDGEHGKSYKSTSVEKRVEALEKRVEALESDQS